MKNILITGGTGFLGSYIARRVLPIAESVTIVTTNIKQKTTLKGLGVNLDKINLVNGDIRDIDFIKRVFNEYEFDTVFHLGALSEVKKCQPDPKLAFDTNIVGTINVLEAARLYGKVRAIIVSSSDKAYGAGTLPYMEDTPMQGDGIYEVSKSCTDLIARSYYSNYSLPVVVTRCSNLFGGLDMNMSRIIPNTIRLALNGISPVVWKGSENAIREFTYIEDAVDAYISLIENIDKTAGEAFNIGSGNVVSIKDLVNMILSKINADISINYKGKDFPEISSQYLDSSKIYKSVGWKSNTTLSDGLDKSIEGYRQTL